jgi:hypothetical protein
MEPNPSPDALATLAQRMRITGIAQLLGTLLTAIILIGGAVNSEMPTPLPLILPLSPFLVLAILPLLLQAVPMLRASAALRSFTEGDRGALELAFGRLGRSLGFEVWVAAMMWSPLAVALWFFEFTFSVLLW